MRATFIALAVFVLSSLRVSAQILVNGSFESPVVSANLDFTAGPFSFTGWSGTVSSSGTGTAGICDGIDFGLVPATGNQHWSFNGDNLGAGTYIEQTFSTTIGQAYSLTYSLGRNGETGASLLAQVDVFNAGGSTLASTMQAPGAGISYTNFSLGFVADSTTTRLRFTDISGSNPNSDLFLDAVAVNAVPEPQAYAAIAGVITLAVVGFLRRWTT